MAIKWPGKSANSQTLGLQFCLKITIYTEETFSSTPTFVLKILNKVYFAELLEKLRYLITPQFIVYTHTPSNVCIVIWNRFIWLHMHTPIEFLHPPLLSSKVNPPFSHENHPPFPAGTNMW